MRGKRNCGVKQTYLTEGGGGGGEYYDSYPQNYFYNFSNVYKLCSATSVELSVSEITNKTYKVFLLPGNSPS